MTRFMKTIRLGTAVLVAGMALFGVADVSSADEVEGLAAAAYCSPEKSGRA